MTVIVVLRLQCLRGAKRYRLKACAPKAVPKAMHDSTIQRMKATFDATEKKLFRTYVFFSCIFSGITVYYASSIMQTNKEMYDKALAEKNEND